jgi:adenine-specific DNA-methyltransferase
LPPSKDILKYYKFEDDKVAARGPYRLQPLATNSMDPRPNLRYPIRYEGEEIWPEKQWQWSKERALASLAANELVLKKSKGKWTVSYKQYLKDAEGEGRRAKQQALLDH